MVLDEAYAIRNPSQVEGEAGLREPGSAPVVGSATGSKMPAVPSFSLVIPAWNEEGKLRRNLGPLLESLDRIAPSFEVIVVADGSTDQTRQVAAAFAGPHLRVVTPPGRVGKGRAILLGARAARYAVIGFVDADCPVTPEALVDLAARTQGCDCVIGSRYMPGSKIDEPMPSSRLLASRVWRSLVRATLKLSVSDTQCGVKFFRRRALEGASSRVAVSGWAFDASLLYHLNRAGRQILEVPVTWRHDPESKVVLGRVAPAMFLALLAIRVANSRSSALVPWRLVAVIADLMELGSTSAYRLSTPAPHR